MLGTTDISASLSLTPGGMDRLKLQAKNDPKAAVQAAAQQFEALFLDMMLKSMREAVPEEGMFDSTQSKMYSGMLDGQLSQKMSAGKGIGLAAMMAKQMERAVTPSVVNLPSAPVPLKKVTSGIALPVPAAGAAIDPPQKGGNAVSGQIKQQDFSSPKDFVNSVWPQATEAARQTGIPAHFMLGHAALESGWGQRQIRNADGSPSYNLFGIKAGSSWKGAVVEAPTTEYVNGVAQKVTAKFRAYGSYTEAFRDYADTLRSNARYDGLFTDGLNAKGFAQGLQQAGYATDPMYASKLTRVLNGTTLRQALVG
jgi:flagellar protein FlgJ